MPATDDGARTPDVAMTTPPPVSTEQPPLPARMLNEYVYCPRLFWLEWVEQDFADNADTVEGRMRHRRVDAGEGSLPAPPSGDSADDAASGTTPALHSRSVWLTDEALRLTARIDLVEAQGAVATPVEYKKGEAPDLPEGAWEPERVQVCAQGLLLRAHGYTSDRGVLYFAASRTRVDVFFDDALVARTLAFRDQALAAAQTQAPPPPLVGSPKCVRCSLAPLCLPDEVNLVLHPPDDPSAGETECRRLLPARDDALPLLVHTQGATVGLSGDCLVVKAGREKLAEVRFIDLSDLSVFGSVQVTTQALRELAGRGIAASWFSMGGWYYATVTGMHPKNILLRRAQFRAAEDGATCLRLARRFTETKILNQRTLVRRNHVDPPHDVLDGMKAAVRGVQRAETLAELLGQEGTAARYYFSALPGMLKAGGTDATAGFTFEGRNRRPARDPVNAMLSFCYALLTKDVSITLQAVGFDPMCGFYHQPRYGKPGLALDVMEEFRPLIADSAVLTAINNGIVTPGDFIRGGTGVALTPRGRAALIDCYARRLDELVTHPVFGYRISYRRVLEVQARLLARHLLGELDHFPAFRTR